MSKANWSTPLERSKALSLLESGKTINDTAKIIGRSRASIVLWKHKDKVARSAKQPPTSPVSPIAPSNVGQNLKVILPNGITIEGLTFDQILQITGKIGVV